MTENEKRQAPLAQYTHHMRTARINAPLTRWRCHVNDAISQPVQTAQAGKIIQIPDQGRHAQLAQRRSFLGRRRQRQHLGAMLARLRSHRLQRLCNTLAHIPTANDEHARSTKPCRQSTAWDLD